MRHFSRRDLLERQRLRTSDHFASFDRRKYRDRSTVRQREAGTILKDGQQLLSRAPSSSKDPANLAQRVPAAARGLMVPATILAIEWMGPTFSLDLQRRGNSNSRPFA
jgi:hypothetical protein